VKVASVALKPVATGSRPIPGVDDMMGE